MNDRLRQFLLSVSAVAVLCSGGCHTSKPVPSNVVPRINQPPPGKALVNFHRPSSYAQSVSVPIFDLKGNMLLDIRDGSLFQIVCDPGETVFISWAQFVNSVDNETVLKADLAPDKVYDVMVDVSHSWISANIFLTPLTKVDARRSELAELDSRELSTLPFSAGSPSVIEYETLSRKRIAQIKKDFLGGEKSWRVKVLAKDDSR